MLLKTLLNSFTDFRNNLKQKMSEEEECAQLQEEETEVLTSIYEGDPCFSSEPDKKCYNYKFGQVNVFPVFLIIS